MALLECDGDRWQMSTLNTQGPLDTFARDVQKGLGARPKWLPAKYFYDAEGSRLYERICELPEYYPYRAEREILSTYADDVRARLGDVPLVEFGSGNAAKTRHLLAAYERAGTPFLYCPVDISREALQQAADHLLPAFPHLRIRALHTDFAGRPEAIEVLRLERKAVAFFGSSLGNFTPEESVEFLRRTAALLGPQDVFLLGIDLKKSPQILVPAYDDAQGVTAAFNLNVLRRINRELGGQFDLDRFTHLARYNAVHGRIEMHLRSTQAQTVHIAATAHDVYFDAGETIHTENSYKYTVAEVEDLGRRANLALQHRWSDRQSYFLVALFRPLGS